MVVLAITAAIPIKNNKTFGSYIHAIFYTNLL